MKKSDFGPRTREDVDLYSTDDLREIYQQSSDKMLRLRDTLITRDELKAEVKRRIRNENLRFWVTLWVVLIGTLAAITAAVEGYFALK